MPSQPTLHLISHSHWDREWYLTQQQFRIKLVHMLDLLLDIFASDPYFQAFMLDGQTIPLEDYLAIRPDKEEQLRALILAGKLQIGPWYILSDEFLASPEALIRNLLEGARICARFGGRMMVGYTPDSFGHIGQLPQILRGFGIETACLWRGLADEPSELEWEAPDGSRVLTLFLRASYSNAANLTMDDPREFVAEAQRQGEKLSPHSHSSHWVLMNGTDHAEPNLHTGANLAYAHNIEANPRIFHSSLPGFFQALAEEGTAVLGKIPVIHGELRSSKRVALLPGVLSTRVWIKQRNHTCQNLLERWAEPASAWAQWFDQPADAHSPYLRDPSPLLRQAWRLLLQCHPHDSICGCSIDQVHEEMRPRFDQVEQIGEEITRQSLERITGRINTLPPEHLAQEIGAIVVFNPAEGPRNGVVESEIDVPESASRFEVVDESGRSAPLQVEGLGTRDLIRVELSRGDFIGSMGMIGNGTVMGLVVRSFHTERQDNRLNIDLVLAESGPLDENAWREGFDQIQRWTSDPTITHYRVIARSPSRVRFHWIANEIPGFGYRTFWVRPVPVEPQPVQSIRISPILKTLSPLAAKLAQNPLVSGMVTRLAHRKPTVTAHRIENGVLAVEIETGTGALTLTDKRSGRVYTGLHRLVDGGDQGDTYNFCPPETDQLAFSRLKRVEVRISEIDSVLEIDTLLVVPTGLSPDRRRRTSQKTLLPIHSRVRLVRDEARIEIHTEIDNRTREHRLRVHFPTPFQVDSASFGGPFEIVNRSLDLQASDPDWAEQPRPEMPQRLFTFVQQGGEGLLVAARGLAEVEVAPLPSGAEIRLTLLRCVGWLSRNDLATRKGPAGPVEATPLAQMPGRQVFDYALVPFSGDPAPAVRQARAFDLPMRAVRSSNHAGNQPAAAALVEPEAGFEITSIKTAEDGSGLIVRGFQDGVGGSTKIRLSLPHKSCLLVRLDETPIETLRPDTEGFYTVSSRPWEIITYKLTA